MNISKIKGEIRNVYNKGFFHFLSARFLIRIFGFGSQLFVAWWLTPEDLGDIKILQVYMSILIVLAGFGFNISTLKLCAEKRPETQIRYLFIKSFKYTAFSVVIVVFMTLLLSKFGLFSPKQRINQLMLIIKLLFQVY